MNATLKKGLALGVLVGAFMMGSAARADAALTAWICNDSACSGGDDLFAVDGGAGDALPGTVGVVSFTPAGGFNGFEVTINTSQSKPAIPGMDLAYVVTNIFDGASPIWLFATDDSFTNGPLTLTGTLGGTQDGGTITALICGGDSNVALNFAPCTTASDNTAGATAISLSHNVTANPYSLAIGVGISADAGIATGDLRVVPEPLSLTLFGLGLSGVAMYRRRRAMGQAR